MEDLTKVHSTQGASKAADSAGEAFKAVDFMAVARPAAEVTDSATVHGRGSSQYEEEIMNDRSVRLEHRMQRGFAATVIFALLAAGYAHVCRGEQMDKMTFSSPEAASHALYLAVESDNEQTITSILGADEELVFLDDNAQNARDRERFAQKYREMHRLVREPDATTVLYIGAENWPFPIPLVTSHGAWHFDAKAGMREVLFRRIGENELSTIQACHALVIAQKEPRLRAGDASPPVPPALVINAGNDGVVIPFHGYYFRVLESPAKGAPIDVHHVSDRKAPDSKFALLAYPADYRVTGVMTYLVDQDDVVYEKDLGRNTLSIAKRMTGYYRDSTWHPAQ